jgi:hypothetical protein
VKRAKVNSETASIQKQLADANKEAQDAMGEFRSWGNPYYEQVWLEAVEKVRRLEREIVRRKMQ